jgi:hypothetical protein
VTGDGFNADPRALIELANGFLRTADQLSQEITALSASALDSPPGVFGLFPSAQDAHSVYVQTAQRALAGLRAVHTTLEAELAQGLRATVANYHQADEDSTPRTP